MVTQPTEPTATPTASAATPTLTAALELLRPFARLLIGQGLKYAEAAEALKRAFVEASLAELARGGTGANTSRISVSTGLHRQDINRLLEQPVDQFARGRSVAAEVYTRWLTDSRYLSDGRPKSLPRSGGTWGSCRPIWPTCPPASATFVPCSCTRGAG